MAKDFPGQEQSQGAGLLLSSAPHSLSHWWRAKLGMRTLWLRIPAVGSWWDFSTVAHWSFCEVGVVTTPVSGAEWLTGRRSPARRLVPPLSPWSFLLGAAAGTGKPGIPLCYLPHFTVSTSTLISRGSLLLFFFFKLAAMRDLQPVIHLYLCLRLPALIWSLPHFQVRVIMFSAPGDFFFLFSQSPLWAVHEVRQWASCSCSWSNRKRTWEHLLPVLNQQSLLYLPETWVQRGKFLSALMFKPGDFASEGVQLECLPDGGFVCSVLVCVQWEQTLQDESRWNRRWSARQPIEKERRLMKVPPWLSSQTRFHISGFITVAVRSLGLSGVVCMGYREEQKEAERWVFELQLCHF